MKINATRDDQETCLIQHYRQKEKILTEKGERIVIKNAITVERKDICPKIAGLKEEEGKGKG